MCDEINKCYTTIRLEVSIQKRPNRVVESAYSLFLTLHRVINKQRNIDIFVIVGGVGKMWK
jgi:hypothetical protein